MAILSFTPCLKEYYKNILLTHGRFHYHDVDLLFMPCPVISMHLARGFLFQEWHFLFQAPNLTQASLAQGNQAHI
jgi:hypothetical protein